MDDGSDEFYIPCATSTKYVTIPEPKMFQQYKEGDPVTLRWNNNGIAPSTTCTVRLYQSALPMISDSQVQQDSLATSSSGSITSWQYNAITASILPYYFAVSCNSGYYIVSNFFTVSKENVSNI